MPLDLEGGGADHGWTMVLLRLSFVVGLLGCGVEFELIEPVGGPGGFGGGSEMSVSSAGGLGGGGGQDVGGQGAGGDSPGCRGTMELSPAVVECVDISDPDPDDCQALYPDELVIDRNELNTGAHHNAYLRFGPIAGAEGVTAVALRMRVATTDLADSAQSGEVWIVQPFDRASLFEEAPATVGSNPAGGDEGPVSFGQDVDWQLPKGVIRADGSVFLGVLPSDDDDGVRYRRDGRDGPKLFVECP